MDDKAPERDSLPVLFLPKHSDVTPGADDDAPTDEQDIAYNTHCILLIKENLRAHGEGAKIRTHYPYDDADSEDIVTLDREGEIVVLDSGTR